MSGSLIRQTPSGRPSGGHIVDAHVHVADSPPASVTASCSPFRAPPGPVVAEPLPSLLDAMAQLDVGQAVLVQPRCLGLDHTYLLECLDSYPDTFVGTALVDTRDQTCLGRLLACAGSAGVTAVRLLPLTVPDVDWFGSDLDGVMGQAAEHSLAVSLLTSPSQMRQVEEWLRRQPEDLVVVLDHLGRPDLGDRTSDITEDLLRLARYPNVHVKLSGLTGIVTRSSSEGHIVRVARAVLAAFGPTRLMWGSDFPFLDARGYTTSLEIIDIVLPDLGEADRRQILGDTARSVFRLPAKASHPGTL